MSGNMIELQPKVYGDVVPRQADFSTALQPGETITYAQTGMVVYSGNDPNPTAMLSGSPSFSGTVVTQTVINGVTGTIYQMTFSVNTSLGNVYTLGGYLAVVPNLP